MARWYSFAIARFAAHPARDERLNVGVIVFEESGLDIFPAKNLEKVRAITSALESTDLRESLLHLSDLDASVRCEGEGIDDRHATLAALSAFDLSPLGRFEAHSDAAYEMAISSLLSRFVEPEPAPFRKTARRSKLLSSLKSALKDEGVLARRGERFICSSRCISLAVSRGLSCGFGSTERLDARH